MFEKLLALARDSLRPDLSDEAFLDRLCQLECKLTPDEIPERDVTAFQSWLRASEFPGIEQIGFSSSPDKGYGLCFQRDIKAGERCLQVPRQFMLSESEFQTSPISALFAEDPIMAMLPSLKLAMVVILEQAKGPASFWSAYIQMLPRSFSIPLYYNRHDWQWLKGTLAYTPALTIMKSLVRAYTHIYGKLSSADLLLSTLGFTWPRFLWAVGVAMTRQNAIPCPDGSRSEYTLIPVWDMCNHADGQVTTQMNMETHCLETFAPRDVYSGDPFYMSYGYRSAQELFLYSGFVPSTIRPWDCVPLEIVLPLRDALFKLRSSLAMKVFGKAIKNFNLYRDWQADENIPLRVMVRILTASANILKNVDADLAAFMDRIQSAAEWPEDEEQKARDWLKLKLAVLVR